MDWHKGITIGFSDLPNLNMGSLLQMWKWNLLRGWVRRGRSWAAFRKIWKQNQCKIYWALDFTTICQLHGQNTTTTKAITSWFAVKSRLKMFCQIWGWLNSSRWIFIQRKWRYCIGSISFKYWRTICWKPLVTCSGQQRPRYMYSSQSNALFDLPANLTRNKNSDMAVF